MRSLGMVALTMCAALAAVGCKKKDDGASTASGAGTASDVGSGAGTASGSGPASGSAGSAAGTAAASGSEPVVNAPPVVVDAAPTVDTANMAHKAGNCPSTVVSATTAIAAPGKDDKAVVVNVTSGNKEAVWAIQTRAKHLVEVQDAPDAKIDHSGKGTGGGGTGLCPIITKSTKIAVTERPDGVAIAITPTGDLKTDALSAEIASRIAKATGFTEQTAKPTDAYGGTGGIGGGAGKHGGNRSGKGDGSGPRGSGTSQAKPAEH
jgi:hypothetical protein